MNDRIFLEAYERVRNRYTEEAWLALNPRQITDEIYREIRVIDTERLNQQNAAPPPSAPDETSEDNRTRRNK